MPNATIATMPTETGELFVAFVGIVAFIAKSVICGNMNIYYNYGIRLLVLIHCTVKGFCFVSSEMEWKPFLFFAGKGAKQ